MSPRTLTLLCVLAVSCAGPASAQTPAPPTAAVQERTISGVVVDADSQAPIAGAEVTSGTARAITDPGGRFALRVPAGEAEITIVATGHFPLVTTLDVRTADVTAAELSLARDAGFATSVAVVASAPTAAPAAETVAPVQVLRTPGALDNVYRTLQTLPGVAATEEFGSRLSVRGGSPDQNLTMMDGVEVHDPYRLFGLTSAFNPETIQRFELATGGFSAKYGDRLSSLLVVENRDGRTGPGMMNGSASLSITDANVVLEGGLPKGAKGSWLVTGRRTYYDLVAERITDQDFPAFQDLQARASWAPSAGTRVTAFSLTSRQAAALEIDEDDARGEFQDDTDNDLAWLRLDATLGTRGQSHTTFGFSDTRSTFGVDAAFQNTSQRSNGPDDSSISTANVIFERGLGVKDLSFRQELAWAFGPHVLETGLEAHRLTTAQRFEITGDRNPVAANGSSVQGGAGLPDLLVSAKTATRGGTWLQDTWQAASTLAASKLGSLPPRRMTWQSSLPMVETMAVWPDLVTDRKWCGELAERMASTAMRMLPSVPFLKPTGQDRPEASSRCTCDSVVRAPMAPQAMRSAVYCGVMVSRNSVAQGRSSSLISSRMRRARRMPSLMRKVLSRRGSLISPFQPTVVRGFSK